VDRRTVFTRDIHESIYIIQTNCVHIQWLGFSVCVLAPVTLTDRHDRHCSAFNVRTARDKVTDTQHNDKAMNNAV